MIVQEYYMTRRDKVRLFRTYSDAGFMIERDGIQYEEAIDPEEFLPERIYAETDIPIPVIEEPEEAAEGGDPNELQNE